MKKVITVKLRPARLAWTFGLTLAVWYWWGWAPALLMALSHLDTGSR